MALLFYIDRCFPAHHTDTILISIKSATIFINLEKYYYG